MLPSEGHVLLWLVLPALLLAAPRSSFRPIPLPTDFSSYDLNGDAAIDVSELANVSDTSEAQATKPFLSADTNHDGLINADEFHDAPWDLQGILGVNQDRKDDEDDQDDQDDQDEYMDEEGKTAYTEDEDEEEKKDEDNTNDDDDDDDDDDDEDDDNEDDDDDDDMDENEDRGIDGDDEDDDEDNSNQ